MSHNPKSNSFLWGFILMVLGGLFLLNNFNYLDFGDFIRTFWPLILVAVGLNMILNKRRQDQQESGLYQENDSFLIHSKPSPTGKSDETITRSESNILGDIKYKFNNCKIDSYSTSNVLGDIKLDFRQASFQPNSKIRINGIIGDVDLRLPQNINIEIHAYCSAGSLKILDIYQDGFGKKILYKTAPPKPNFPWLTIDSSIVLGEPLISPNVLRIPLFSK